jgi:hypothetical protein
MCRSYHFSAHAMKTNLMLGPPLTPDTQATTKTFILVLSIVLILIKLLKNISKTTPTAGERLHDFSGHESTDLGRQTGAQAQGSQKTQPTDQRRRTPQVRSKGVGSSAFIVSRRDTSKRKKRKGRKRKKTQMLINNFVRDKSQPWLCQKRLKHAPKNTKTLTIYLCLIAVIHLYACTTFTQTHQTTYDSAT